MNLPAPLPAEPPVPRSGLRRLFRWTTAVPVLIVLAAATVAALLLLQERQEFAELRASINEENHLRMQSSLGHVEDYFDAVYSSLLFISLDDDVMALRRNSHHYIQKLYDHQWQNHRLTEVYVVEQGFTGQRPPFMTFERETDRLTVEEVHSLAREADEYRVQIQQLRQFAGNLPIVAELSSEIFLCQPNGAGGRSRGYVYSVPIRSSQGLVGLVAGMIQKSTLSELLRQGLNRQVALLVSERGDVVLPEGADPAIEAGLRQEMGARGVGEFFSQAPGSFRLGQWWAHWSSVKIVDAQKWWLVYLHPATDFEAQTLLAGQVGHLTLAGSLLGLGIALAFQLRSLAKRLDQQVRHLRERRQLERDVQEVSEREQRRIGTNLHEDLCQRLTGIEAASRMLERRLGDTSSPETPVAAEISREIKVSLHSARQMADELQPVALLEHGFVAALEELASHTRQRARLTCLVRDHGFPENLDIFIATHLYRIVQEAVANSVKHARANSIYITLEANGGELSLAVSDDGLGISDSAGAGPGIGLRIMRYRAELIGAQLEVSRVGQHGTTVAVQLPCPSRGPKLAASSPEGCLT